ncbi:hypothetical protein HYV71_02785 [Candidatus Uhrbacteria bacterium]|nr:hypothetical protein [Candidatus Uhrbacteria bacterium]
MIDYQQFFDIQYWFTLNPGFLSIPATIGFAVFFGLCISASLGLTLMARKRKIASNPADKVVLAKTNTLLISMGIIGYCLLFFSYQAIPIFSMRFLYLVWGLGFAIWAYVIWHYAATEVPRIKDEREKKRQLEKYTLKK